MTELPVTTSEVVAPTTWRDRYPSGPWTLAGVALCGCAVVSLVDPTRHMVTPPCPMRALTGWWCPLCGATRAASRVLRGDLVGAFHFNAVFLLLMPVALAVWAAMAFPGRLRWLDPVRARNTPILLGVGAVLIAFTIVRNTPLGDTWLRYPGA
jgi:hypothetical protein